MSVRAYRIKKISFEKNPTFNLWNSEYVLNFLHENGIDNIDSQESGSILEIPTEVLCDLAMHLMARKAEVLLSSKQQKDDEYILKRLNADLDIAEKTGEKTIRYYCF